MLLEQRPALAERRLHQVVVAEREHVERDELGRCLLGEHPHPRLGGVDALLEGVEVEALALGVGDDDLTVDHTPLRQRSRRAPGPAPGSTG